MELLIEFLKEWGIIAGIVSLGFWWLKKKIDTQEADRLEQEKATQELVLIMLKEVRANNILAMATAKAVQRIPDAHCNGDMRSAIDQASKLQMEEKNFVYNQGIKHIFRDN